MGEIAEQIAQRVPELAIGLDIGLDDLRADAEVLGVVRAHGPEPQDLGARLADHVLRRHHVAERFRHLAPVLVDDEAVRHHRVIGRAAARAACLEQRGLEPAAMLVRAFEIEVGRPFEIGPLFQHERMRRAGIEPDIENVGDLLPIVRVVDQACRKRCLAPCLNQASAPSVSESLDDPARSARPSGRSLARGITSLVSLCRNTVIGTPQARWRETTQSGRVSIMPVMRFSPCGGTQRVSAIDFSARARSVPPRRSPCPWR